MPIQPWPKSETKALGNFRIFSLRAETKTSPRTGLAHDFFVIDSVNWVNVIALTPDDQFVLVEQFRHGTNTVELEIPGGVMDVGDPSPEATAIRELREETGYEGERAIIIGQVYANPAIMTNTCFTVLVDNCRLRHAPALDGAEDLHAHVAPVSDMPGLVASGRIRHSLVVAAIYHYELWRRAKS